MLTKLWNSPAAGRWAANWALLAMICLMVALPRTGQAQAYYGAIVGNVTDTSGSAIVGAKVTVTANATNTKFSTTSSSIGAYSLAQLPIGVYTVEITAPNFKSFVADTVEVHVSTNTSVNAELQPGAVTETVTVESTQVQVETTSAAAGEVVSGSQVRELPLNGENFVGLTQLSPGVSAAASYDGQDKGLEGGVNFSVNGNPYTNNLFLVDGVNNNDVGSNRTILVYPAVDTIAEFKMIRNSFGPEYGQASGAIISLTTKSGTNQFHGGFFYSGRNDVLDANNWFNNNQGTGKAKLRRNDWGYNGSGPIWKDHVFLWWNQEWNREIRGTSFGSCVPTDAESGGDFSAYTTAGDQCGANVPGNGGNPGFPSWVGTTNKIANPDAAGLLIAQFYPSPNYNSDQTKTNPANGFNWSSAINNPLDWSEWNVRPDWDLNKRNRVTFRWTQDSWKNPAPNVGDAFWGESDFPTVQSTWDQPSKSVMAKLSTTITSSMINDVEFGYGWNAIITTLAGTRASIVPAIQKAYPATFPGSLKQPDEFFGNWGGFNPYGSYETYASFWNIAPYHNHEDLYTVQDNLSWVKGNHLLKVGAFYSDNLKAETNGNGADRPAFPNGTVYCAPGQTGPPASPTAGMPACVDTLNSLANALVPGTGTSPQMFSGISEGSQDVNAQVKWHDFEWYLGDTWKVTRRLTVDYGFRWSFYREPYSADNQWATWDVADWSAAQATSNPQDACNGLIVAKGTHPCEAANKLLQGLGVNLGLSSGTQGSSAAIIPNNNHDIAPRLGVVWDLFGNGRTALRFGAGQFYQREAVGLDEGMEHGAPFSLSASSNRSLDTPAPLSGGAVSPNYTKELRAVTPHAWQWNATIEQEVHRNTTLEIGYVGNAGVHLTSMEAGNPVPQASWILAATNAGSNSGTGQNPWRPATNFAGINGFAREGHASYHSLQTLFRSQWGPSTFQAAYTWSHSLGDVELDNSSGGANQELPTVQGNDSLDKGNTNINRPNIFVANEVYYLPKFAHANALVQNTAGGWEFNSIFSAAHGSSLTVFMNGGSGNVSQLIGTGYNGNNRPLTTGQSCNAGEKGNHILNSGAFTLIGYTLGTVPSSIERRGYCYGAPTTDWDSQLAKNWQIKERYRIKFAMDFFDILNHPNFNSSGLEGTGWVPPSFGCGAGGCSASNPTITTQAPVTGFGTVSTLQIGRGNRELQYSLKFSF
ncbi:MAG TPA: carboxypeptidase regulatory-like domain-containing protein [Terracidiphilus sp.]|jgi:hypothetical protein|nr:carboxypeptidase regulatory-like domain-containing protein [Terracidiphilus sp.]